MNRPAYTVAELASARQHQETFRPSCSEGACQGTAWAGLCLIHHHQTIMKRAVEGVAISCAPNHAPSSLARRHCGGTARTSNSQSSCFYMHYSRWGRRASHVPSHAPSHITAEVAGCISSERALFHNPQLFTWLFPSSRLTDHSCSHRPRLTLLGFAPPLWRRDVQCVRASFARRAAVRSSIVEEPPASGSSSGRHRPPPSRRCPDRASRPRVGGS